jgi:nucleoside-diphosphate-sugar epimerase
MIFITGGTGFLGRHLVSALCREGASMRVLTRKPAQNAWLKTYARVDVVQGDLSAEQSFESALAGCEQVIHAAGLFSMWGGAGDFYATNTQGTARLLKAAQVAGVRRFLYVSTIAVIGEPQKGVVIDETHPCKPSDAYQASKLEAERMVLEANGIGGMQTLVVRPGAFYGELGNYAFNRLFFTDPMRGIIMQMDGGSYVIFPVYIRDVVQGIQKAMAHGRAGEVYHICGECLSHRAAFDEICRQAGLRYPRLNIPRWLGLGFAWLLTSVANVTKQEPFYPIGLKSYVFNDWNVSSEKAKRELGFVPTPFAQGVAQTLAWYKNGKPTHLPELEC